MYCELCGMFFPVAAGVVVHKLIEHKINENGNKISNLVKSMQTEDVLNSSDSECEYKIVVSVQRVTKTEKDAHHLPKSNETSAMDFIEKQEADDHPDYDDSTIHDDGLDAVYEDSSEDAFDYHYQCYLCKEQYVTLTSLRNHFNKLHGIVDKRKSFRKKKEKQQKKTKCENFFCKRCSRLFMNRNEIEQHRNDGKCKPLQPTKFVCTYCGKVILNSTTYRNHVRRHENDKPFKCDICTDVAYTVKSALMRHMNKHTGENQYICPIPGCHKTFSQAGTVKAHWTKVHGPKELECPYCNKMFSCKNYMAEHIRRHTGERPFRCKLCFRAFLNKSKCAEHEKTHTGAKPYKCKICQKGYTTPHNLRTHNKTVKCKLLESSASN